MTPAPDVLQRELDGLFAHDAEPLVGDERIVMRLAGRPLVHATGQDLTRAAPPRPAPPPLPLPTEGVDDAATAVVRPPPLPAPPHRRRARLPFLLSMLAVAALAAVLLALRLR